MVRSLTVWLFDLFTCFEIFSLLKNLLIFFSYPLVLTQKSETIKKAFQRYAHTGLFILQLYSELPWQEKSIVRRVNKFHSNAAEKIRSKSKFEIRRKVDDIFRSHPTNAFGSFSCLDEVFFKF